MIDAARDELAEAYRRLKTFEVTQEQREDAEEKEFNRREQIDLDEIGLNLHRRRTSAG
jgi:flagellar biosynthesis chaperone FliJ